MSTLTTAEEVDVVELVDGLDRPEARRSSAVPSAEPLIHFQLETHPFADNVNPDFFFRTESHEEAFILMKRAVEDNASLAMCTALSGTGKTLLTQILLQELSTPRHRTILTLVYPEMSRTALLRDIIAELDIETPPPRASIHTLLSLIQEEIIRLYRGNQKLVIIIDEAHFLRLDSLHILRTLSNIEVPEKKLISVLLFGEDHFRERLERRRCHRALLSRMFVRCSLRPLTLQEVEQYIKFRCLMAGGKPDIFDESAFEPIAATTRGIPREINRLAHNAMISAARRSLSSVGGDLIESLIKSGAHR